MKFLAALLMLAGLCYFVTGTMLNYASYEGVRAKEIRERQWQSAVVEKCAPVHGPVKWSEKAIDASIRGLK